MNLNNLYKNLVKIALQNDSMTFSEAVDRVLDKGVVSSGGSSKTWNYGIYSEEPLTGVETEAIYVIGSVETVLKYTEAVGGGNASIYASVETYLKAVEAQIGATRENFLFLPNINKINNIDADATDRIMDKGVVELSWFRVSKDGIEVIANENDTLGNFSFLTNFMKDFDVNEANAIDRILDKGLVFYVDPYRSVMASIETYLKFGEAVGLTMAVPA